MNKGNNRKMVIARNVEQYCIYKLNTVRKLMYPIYAIYAHEH